MVSIIIKIGLALYFIPVSLQLWYLFCIFRLANYIMNNPKKFNKIKIRNQEDCELFGIDIDATDEIIKEKYKKLALLNHPDKCGGNTEEMAKINDAKDRLLGITKSDNIIDQLNEHSEKEIQYYKNICLYGWYKIYPIIYYNIIKPLLFK